MRSGFRYRAAARLGRWLFDALLGTVRFELVGDVDMRRRAVTGPPVVFVLWHGRLLPLTYFHRGQGIATLISRSEDGEYIARIVEGWGYRTARGSSSRAGDAGLRALLRLAGAGHSLAVTPDGPRGPRQKMKLGAIVAAQRTGLPLVPATAGADRGWYFGSWDRFLVPRPFTRVRVAYGQPCPVPADATQDELQACADRLESELDALTRMVDAGAREP